MRCASCQHWTVSRITTYADKSEIVEWKAKEGRGLCSVLDHETAAAFGCIEFSEGTDCQIIRKYKQGEPWQHWVMIPCPDCDGKGSQFTTACRRCAGTSKVRRYDDGFVGEEQTRLHPKEKQLMATGGLPRPKCLNCNKDTDVSWVACPYCGWRLVEPPAEVEVVGYDTDQQGTTPDLLSKMRAAKARDREAKAGEML